MKFPNDHNELMKVKNDLFGSIKNKFKIEFEPSSEEELNRLKVEVILTHVFAKFRYSRPFMEDHQEIVGNWRVRDLWVKLRFFNTGVFSI